VRLINQDLDWDFFLLELTCSVESVYRDPNKASPSSARLATFARVGKASGLGYGKDQITIPIAAVRNKSGVAFAVAHALLATPSSVTMDLHLGMESLQDFPLPPGMDLRSIVALVDELLAPTSLGHWDAPGIKIGALCHEIEDPRELPKGRALIGLGNLQHMVYYRVAIRIVRLPVY